jgi:hypothetical protein
MATVVAVRHQRVKNEVCDLCGTLWALGHLAQVALISSHIAIQELYSIEMQKLMCQNILQ